MKELAEETVAQFREAIDRKRADGADSDDLARTLHGLAQELRELGGEGREEAYAEALSAYKEALRLLNSQAWPRSYGVVVHDIADLEAALGREEEAVAHYREAAEHKRAGDADPEDLALTLHCLGRKLEELGGKGREHADAEALSAYQETLRLLNPQEEPRSYGVVLDDIADMEAALGRKEESVVHYRSAVEHMRAGDADPDDLALTLHSLGRELDDLGSRGREGGYAEALSAYQEALDLLDPQEWPRFYGVVLHDIANMEAALGRKEEAVAHYREAAEHQRAGGPDPDNLAVTLHSLGRELGELGGQGREEAYAEALAAYHGALGLLNPQERPRSYAVLLHDIADIEVALGRKEEAVAHYREAAEHKQAPGADSDDLAVTLEAFSLAMRRTRS
jgi:tetratricopeptide (TPR) repeat protein